MWTTVLAGVTALSVCGAGLAFAQQAPAPTDTPRWRPSAEDMAALADARIAALRTGLKLSAEQEKHWPAVEAALRDLDKQRADRMSAMAQRRDAARSGTPPARPDAIERLRRGADAMAARGAALKQLADAAEPLYKSLDDSQKQRFALLMRMGQPAGGPAPWRRRG